MPKSEATGKVSLLIVFLIVFIDLLGFGMVLPLLPVYAADFARQLNLEKEHLTIGLLIGFLMSSFSLMQFLFAPLWGRISDRIGRRPVLLVGLAGSVAFYSLFGVATVMKSLPLLFASRIGAGIAGATISTAQAYIADATTLANRARGMALIGAAFGLGFTFGPLFGLLAVPSEGGDPGPGPGYAAALLSAGALALAWFKLPESLQPGMSRERHWFDRRAGRRLGNAWRGHGAGGQLRVRDGFLQLRVDVVADGQRSRGGLRLRLPRAAVGVCLRGRGADGGAGGRRAALGAALPEKILAAAGACIEVVGFGVLALAATHVSSGVLFAGLATVVTGFAFITPSLNSLLSRWSDPAKQGGILGIGQSITSLARIVGPMIGVPLFENRSLADAWNVASAQLPSFFAAGLMVAGLALIVLAAGRGRDFAAGEAAA